VALALSILAMGPPVVEAATYTGRGDTGHEMYTRKQDCCDAAIYAAQENSMALCRRAGGFAEAPRGVASGRCKWERRQASAGTTYWRCSATASVRCR